MSLFLKEKMDKLLQMAERKHSVELLQREIRVSFETLNQELNEYINACVDEIVEETLFNQSFGGTENFNECHELE